MAHQVWKCDYCSKIHKVKEEISYHERVCILHPGNKSCVTCDKFIDYGDIESCTDGITRGSSYPFKCSKWEIKNELK